MESETHNHTEHLIIIYKLNTIKVKFNLDNDKFTNIGLFHSNSEKWLSDKNRQFDLYAQV